MQTENITAKPVKELTTDDIRSIPGNENMSDEQADTIIDDLKQFCHMVYNLLHGPNKVI